jgi:FRG domain
MNEIVAESWLHVQTVLFSRDDLWNDSLRRFRSPMAYRGLDRASHTLVTSLNRLGGDFANLEGHVLRNFKKYAHRELVERNTDWHWLDLLPLNAPIFG